MEKFGKVSASDHFEVPLSATNGIAEKIILKDVISKLVEKNAIKIVTHA
jgi:hypothetical protein